MPFAPIEEKNYVATLILDSIVPENIRKYGFAFEGKTVLFGWAMSAGRKEKKC